MDMDSFYQCLSYMQKNVTSAVDYWSAIIGVGGTLGGVYIGYYLNSRQADKKEALETDNNVLICKEEVIALQEELLQAMVETGKIAMWFGTNDPAPGVSMPSRIRARYIEEFFAKVCNKFSENQRSWVRILLNLLDDLNQELPGVTVTTYKSSYVHSQVVTRSWGLILTAWKLCEWIKHDKQTPLKYEEIMKTCQLPDEQHQQFWKLHRNIANNNRDLNLK